jgi:hypothetical protein
VRYQIIGSAEEDFRRQVPAQFAAEGALDWDGLKREFLYAGRHIAAATLAGHNENFPA